MRIAILLVSALVLVSCDSLRAPDSHLRITCGEGGGVGQWFGLGGTVRKMTHSDPEHTFTDAEMALFEEMCPSELDAVRDALDAA